LDKITQWRDLAESSKQRINLKEKPRFPGKGGGVFVLWGIGLGRYFAVGTFAL
jgi:hypothetical protein